MLCVNPVLGSSLLKVYPSKEQPSKSSTAIMKYLILLLCYSSKVCHMLGVENSCNLKKISHWISNAKVFPLVQVKPNPSNYPVLFSLYARIFYWIFCCLSLESAMWGRILSEHGLFILNKPGRYKLGIPAGINWFLLIIACLHVSAFSLAYFPHFFGANHFC